jgi:hypothetical protein
LLITSAYSQDILWGSTQSRGLKGGGTSFSVKMTGADFTLQHTFELKPGPPSNSLIQGSNGFLYGMTPGMTSKDGGITYKYGTIFKIAADGSGFKVLKQFDFFNDGGFLQFSLIEGKDSRL